MKTIIVGAGEVGKALGTVLKDYKPEFVDPARGLLSSSYSCDYLHICFPYSDDFIEQVEEYKDKYVPKYLIVHSSVPVGTCQELDAIHSPIRGIHPNLESGIRTFVKFIGGEQASEVADYFRRAGLRVMLFDDSRTTEAMKLYDTEYYRECVNFALRVQKFCDENELNFHEVYTLANQTYNEGYTKLGHPEYVRPVLQAIRQPIGGHCLEPNHEIITKQEND